MLVLSRQKNQEIVIEVPGYDPIIISVTKCHPDEHVRLGIQADKRFSVHRKEVYDAIQRGEVKDTPIERKEPQ